MKHPKEVVANDNANANDNAEIPIPLVEATPLFRTTIRQKITPYLPPPVVVAMRQIDPQLEPYIGPEPTVTLLGSLLLAVFLWKLFGTTLGRKGKAIANMEEDDDEDLPKDDRYFHATLLFCGPSLAGKTSLFYQLVHPSSSPTTTTTTRIRTVKSIKSHRDFWVVGDNQKTIRVLDTPGHWGPTKLMDTFLKKETIDRIVLVVDSTQPVASAADYLYALLLLSLDRKIPIMVACHKSKSTKAKNFRRIKLQLRTELERLAKLDTTNNNNNKDWDQLLQTCGFCSSSCEDPPVLDELKAFCQTGTLAASS
jgi:signal recognition particle receptor subunit beta